MELHDEKQKAFFQSESFGIVLKRLGINSRQASPKGSGSKREKRRRYRQRRAALFRAVKTVRSLYPDSEVWKLMDKLVANNLLGIPVAKIPKNNLSRDR